MLKTKLFVLITFIAVTSILVVLVVGAIELNEVTMIDFGPIANAPVWDILCNPGTSTGQCGG